MPQSKVSSVEQQILDVLETMDESYLVVDGNFIILRANASFEKLSGKTRKDIIGKSMWDVFPEAAQHDSRFWIDYHEVIRTKKPVSFKHYTVTNNDWVQVTAYPTSGGGVFIFVHDITAKVNAEESLRESEARLRALVNASVSYIYRVSPDGKEMYILDEDNLQGKGVHVKNWVQKYIPKHEQDRLKYGISEAMRKKEVFQFENQMIRPDGSIGWIFTRCIPIFDDKGKLTEWFGAATDITDLVQAQDEHRNQQEVESRMEMLTEQRNTLLKMNQTKNEFISLASHQLRTPATAVKQYLGMLTGNFAGPLTPEQERLVTSAYESNERELQIITDLIRTAQLDTKANDLTTGKHDIINLLQDVIDDLIPTLQQRHQQIKFDHKGKGTRIVMDAAEMKLAFSNLIENASKYSYDGSAIKVRVTPQENSVEVSVMDDGIGIDKENHEMVFEKFTRISNGPSEDITGSGLGLYWVKQIAEMHGGSVRIESTPGKGSTFILTLPLVTKSSA